MPGSTRVKPGFGQVHAVARLRLSRGAPASAGGEHDLAGPLQPAPDCGGRLHGDGVVQDQVSHNAPYVSSMCAWCAEVGPAESRR
jgi:hypothetical protein